MTSKNQMDPEAIEAMATDFAAWVNHAADALAEGIELDAEGVPEFKPGVTRGLQQAVAELSPNAARYALVAALIALVGARA